MIYKRLKKLTILFACLFIGSTTNVRANLVAPVPLDSHQVLIVDADTDTVLFSHNASMRMTPSSMTKILTAYLLFQDIKAGKITLDSEFLVSSNAAKTEGTKMYLRAGSKAKVRELIEGIFVASANDACVCVAENLSGSEGSFAQRMNLVARQMGAANSNFLNAAGLPDPNHYSTCEDLYKIANRLYQDYPEYIPYFSQAEFKYEKGKGAHYNLNSLLKTFPGTDGLKTGHTKAWGYGVVASAKVNNQRIFLVINGCKTMIQRNKYTQALMAWAYSAFEQVKLFSKSIPIASIDTWIANTPKLEAVLHEDVRLTIPRGAVENLSVEAVFHSPVEPPVNKDAKVGELIIKNMLNETSRSYPLYANHDIKRANFLQRIPMILYYLVFGVAASE